MITKIQEGTLLVLSLEIEDLRAWLIFMIDKDLVRVTPHPKKLVLQRINEICYLKYLAISLGIKKRHLEVELTFIDLHFDNITKLNMPPIQDQLDVLVSINIWMINNQSYFDNKIDVDVSRQEIRDLLKLKQVTDDAITRVMSLGQLVESLTIFRFNINKLKGFPIIQQMDLKDLKGIHDKIKLMLPLELTKLSQSTIDPKQESGVSQS